MGQPILISLLPTMALDFDRQKADLEEEIDMEIFKDPEKIDDLINRFLIIRTVEDVAAGDNSQVAQLFQSDPLAPISVDLVV